MPYVSNDAVYNIIVQLETFLLLERENHYGGEGRGFSAVHGTGPYVYEATTYTLIPSM